MKKLLLFAVMIAMTITATAQSKKNYSFSGFTELQVGSVFDVELVKSNNYSVNVEYSKEYEKYLEVNKVGDCLVVAIHSNNNRFFNSPKLKLYVSMPYLNALSISGAAKLNAQGSFTSNNDMMKIRVSGASQIKTLNISGKNLNTQISGSSHASFSAKFDEAVVEASGASSFSGKIDSKQLACRASGASKIEATATSQDVILDATGASQIKIEGSANKLAVDCSGASNVNARNFKVNDAKAELAGARSANLYVNGSLDVDISGGSNCSYKSDNNNVKVHDRSSRLKFEK